GYQRSAEVEELSAWKEDQSMVDLDPTRLARGRNRRLRVARKGNWPIGLFFALALVLSACAPAGGHRDELFRGAALGYAGSSLDRINHIIVIYQENHTFDNYFGTFPGADGVANAGDTATQVDKQGRPYSALPQPLANAVDGKRSPDPRFPSDLPNGPFLFND